MRISKCNSEGYPDPTAYEALTSIVLKEKQAKKYMPKVFISSPFACEVETNVINARKYCAYAVKCGYIPFAPHLFFPQFMDDNDKEQRFLGMLMGKIFLDSCRELWAFGKVISPGMQEEINRAKAKGILIRLFDENCKEVKAWDFPKN